MKVFLLKETDEGHLILILPITKKHQLLPVLSADRTGLEPATSAVTGRHSNQLNYRSKLGWQR